MSGDSKAKGFAPRLIQTPGYHIHPQFDLVHTRHLINERKTKKSNFNLSLAPMVDMFSILVIYLIMNFSTSGEIFFVSKDISIPKASRGMPLMSFPLLSVVNGKVLFDAEKVGGSDTVYIEEVNDEKVPQLRSALRRIKKIEMDIGGPSAFKGQINLQADRNTPIDEVKKIMRVLIDEGWMGVNFVVDPSK